MISAHNNHKRGMLIVVVGGVLVFSMIIFLSLVSRVRHESAVTNRVSVSERLYQIASAVGRLSVRKLQKDFETRDPEFGQKIINAAFSDMEGPLESVDYSDVIKNLDVVKEIRTRFKSEWGDRGDVTFDVTYIADLGKKFPFKAPIAGLANSPFERQGHITFVVTATHMGISKTCRMRKEFLLTRLLAPPFYRFTLFSHRGATVDATVANGLMVTDDGKLSGSKRPMVCINRFVRNKKENIEGLDFRFNRADNIVKNGVPSFVKNGWIYLGGRGSSTDASGDSGNLILNVVTGSFDDILENAFGEYFHFYFNPNSAGWLILKDWTKWFDDRIPENDDVGADARRVMVAFVDYGNYKGLWDINFRNNPLFAKTRFYYERDGKKDALLKGSSMHLFGTPALCTPTLVFGKIKRRYVRTFALYFSEAARVYPLRLLTRPSEFSSFISNEVYDWYKEISGSNTNEAFIDNFVAACEAGMTYTDYQIGFPSTTPPLCGLVPLVLDWEPYMSGLHNICDPGGPDLSWSQVVPENGYVDAGPETLCKTDYLFKNDNEIHFNGSITQINPGDAYLRERMSYMIPAEAGKPIYLSQCDFFQNHFVTEEGGKKLVYLNQIIGFDGDLVIDEPLEVAKGGVIVCNGSITVKEPIVNPYVTSVPDNPDAFGYLTLIGKKGITLAKGKDMKGTLPQMHGFFVSLNNGNGKVSVTPEKGLHIIGGVACDNIEDLVDKGCIIEWGFDPLEISGGKDFSTPDFYGLSMGPRDIEIITEE